MSTIQSSAEHLTLNADGSGNDIKFQSNGSQVASISDGGVVTATSFAGSGAALTGVGVAGISSSADATAITITSAEDVGIGTSSPSKTLSVHSTSGSAGTPNGLYLYNEVHGSDSQIYMYGENDSGSIQGANIKLDPDAETFSLIGTGNQTAISIDDDGRVTSPNQPSFRAYKTASNTGGGLDWNGTYHNVGGHFNVNNGRFTAPIAGYYFISMHYLTGNNTDQTSVTLNLNSSADNGIRLRAASSSGHNSTSAAHIIYLSANDYILPSFNNGEVYGDVNKSWTEFSGHLLG